MDNGTFTHRRAGKFLRPSAARESAVDAAAPGAPR
jgi:hypothetical protein